jgi:hypothetical protein
MNTCEAIITWTKGDYRFTPVYCTQTVGIRGYWSRNGSLSDHADHFVTYCSIPGHRENCERRFPPEPDAIDAAKWEADRRDSWTLA